MRVSVEETFKPLTIKLESQAEVDWLSAIIGACPAQFDVEMGVGESVITLYNFLKRYKTNTITAYKIKTTFSD
jgi:hypothetical protein